MVTQQQIRAFVDEVVARFHPQGVILFGSYAYGQPSPDSDVDLLVVMPHQGLGAVQAATIRRVVRAGFPLDLVVRSPQELQRRLGMGDCFICEIVQRGRPLYEAGHV